MTAQPVEPPLSAEEMRALDIARGLARAGVPIFVAKADPDGPDGFRLPRRWQWTTPDPRVVDTWRRGDGLAALMGVVIDLVDIDPRNGGDGSWASIASAGVQPQVWAKSQTPSGGEHLFVARLRAGSRDRIRPGIDIKGGRDGLIERAGRGLAWLAPTVKASKVTGVRSAYRWEQEPSFLDDWGYPDSDALADLLADESGAELAEIVRAELSSGVTALPVPGASGPYAANPFRIFTPAEAMDYIEAQLRKLEDAQDGEINQVLFGSAVLVGHFVPALLDEVEAVAMLKRALSATLYDGRTWKAGPTIRSGMERGMSEPYDIVDTLPEPPAPDDPSPASPAPEAPAPSPSAADIWDEVVGQGDDAAGQSASSLTDDQAAAYEAKRAELIERRIAERVQQMSIDDEARRRRTSAARPAAPGFTGLGNFLAQEFPELKWRIDGLLPVEGIVMFSAPQKAGKSTLVGNLVRSLADGEAFLDHFPVPEQLRVGLLDTELGERRLHDWLTDQRVKHVDNVQVMSLRGLEAALDPRDPDCRKVWVPMLAGLDVVILDVVGPVTAALGLDENSNSDVAVFWTSFRALLIEAGVPTGLVVHHTGHNEARAVGASAWLRYPDAIWKLEREDEEPTSARLFSAYGRDVEVYAGALKYESLTRRLSYTGVGRGQLKATRHVGPLVELLTEHGPQNQTQCAALLVGAGVLKSRDQARRVPEQGVRDGLLLTWTVGRSQVFGVNGLHVPPAYADPAVAS
jgi:hypothetical protein